MGWHAVKINQSINQPNYSGMTRRKKLRRLLVLYLTLPTYNWLLTLLVIFLELLKDPSLGSKGQRDNFCSCLEVLLRIKLFLQSSVWFIYRGVWAREGPQLNTATLLLSVQRLTGLYIWGLNSFPHTFPVSTT